MFHGVFVKIFQFLEKDIHPKLVIQDKCHKLGNVELKTENMDGAATNDPIPKWQGYNRNFLIREIYHITLDVAR